MIRDRLARVVLNPRKSSTFRNAMASAIGVRAEPLVGNGPTIRCSRSSSIFRPLAARCSQLRADVMCFWRTFSSSSVAAADLARRANSSYWANTAARPSVLLVGVILPIQCATCLRPAPASCVRRRSSGDPWLGSFLPQCVLLKPYRPLPETPSRPVQIPQVGEWSV